MMIIFVLTIPGCFNLPASLQLQNSKLQQKGFKAANFSI